MIFTSSQAKCGRALFISLVLFLNRVEESYRRMVNPACQVVDASPSKEEVLQTVLQLIKKHCAL
uniref:Uncharacterized protein n=1 Tax=Accipiter nisus TaxID=211598 RepID=A0A8B9M8P7_9AVES